MEQRLTLIVHLHLATSDISAFEAFEREAARIMARHGGTIERAVRINAGGGDPELPFEIHVVSFPDQGAFDAYRSDPEVLQLAARRAELIDRTEIFAGHDVPPYH